MIGRRDVVRVKIVDGGVGVLETLKVGVGAVGSTPRDSISLWRKQCSKNSLRLSPKGDMVCVDVPNVNDLKE